MTITLEAPGSIDNASDRVTTRFAWHPACRIDDLEPAWGEAMLVGGKQIALYRVPRPGLAAAGTEDAGTEAANADTVYAACHRDPHSGAPVMARGIVGSKGDRPTVASPLLKQVYDLGTGQCFTDAALHLRPFRTRVIDGMVEVEIPL